MKWQRMQRCLVSFIGVTLLLSISLAVDCAHSMPAEGDITAVIAGMGLTGGGETGDVTLSVQVPLDLSGASMDAIVKGTNVNVSGKGPGVSGITHARMGVGVSGKNTKSNNYGYVGSANSGVYGSSKSGTGVYGKNTAGGNFGYLGSDTYGVYGETKGEDRDAVGVYGKNVASGNVGFLGHRAYGVVGQSRNDTGVYGLSDTHHGVYGKNIASGNVGFLGSSLYGVYGRNTSTGNRGYLASSDYGVYGHSTDNVGFLASSDYGVYGENIASGNFGFLGHRGYGVFGLSRNDTGVYGSSDTATGVYGESRTGTGVYGGSASGFAGEFHGNIKVTGKGIVSVLQITGGTDLSEEFEIRTKEDALPTSGMVVSIDPENPGNLVVSSNAYDRRVAGIISGAGNVESGMIMGQSDSVTGEEHPVALTGRVYCLVDASNGSIQPGDLLTTSDTPGHAMKVIDYTRAQGAILGKAMSSLKSGQGLVLVLVSLQ